MRLLALNITSAGPLYIYFYSICNLSALLAIATGRQRTPLSGGIGHRLRLAGRAGNLGDGPSIWGPNPQRVPDAFQCRGVLRGRED